MKLPVTENGVTLPKAWFGNATEVEVRQENGHVRVDPLEPQATDRGTVQPYDPTDPIWQIGKRMSDQPIPNASAAVDKYLYGDLK
jgi:hypothetical protein